MEKEMMNKIIKLAKISEQKMSEETGVYSSMSENDISEYLNQIIAEKKLQMSKN